MLKTLAELSKGRVLTQAARDWHQWHVPTRSVTTQNLDDIAVYRRAPNAYTVYVKEFAKTENTRGVGLMKAAAEKWNSFSTAEKQVYTDKSRAFLQQMNDARAALGVKNYQKLQKAKKLEDTLDAKRASMDSRAVRRAELSIKRLRMQVKFDYPVNDAARTGIAIYAKKAVTGTGKPFADALVEYGLLADEEKATLEAEAQRNTHAYNEKIKNWFEGMMDANKTDEALHCVTTSALEYLYPRLSALRQAEVHTEFQKSGNGALREALRTKKITA